MIGLTVPNGCRELSRMVERPSQRAMEQHVLAQVKFGQRLEHAFNDPNVMLTTTSTDSSLTLIFQDSTIVAMSDGAKAAFAHRAALFVRDHYGMCGASTSDSLQAATHFPPQHWACRPTPPVVMTEPRPPAA
jgi:hypothetical protein